MTHTASQQSAAQTIACGLLFLVFFMAAASAVAQNNASASTSSMQPQIQEEHRSSEDQKASQKSPSQKSDNGFLKRLLRAYRDDWSGAAPAGAEPARRIPPAPLDSPPFPNSDWPYGGAPDIGAPDTNVYPLMQAINGASSKVKVYGWVEPSVNAGTSRHSLFPSGYDIYSNTAVLDQAVLYIEKLVDTVQAEHVDFGFHLTGFYGVDYRFTTAKGWLSQQLLKYNRQSHVGVRRCLRSSSGRWNEHSNRALSLNS